MWRKLVGCAVIVSVGLFGAATAQDTKDKEKDKKDGKAAKRTLENLVAQYPDSPAAQTAKERLQSLR